MFLPIVSKSAFAGTLRRFLRRQDGSAAIEFAFVAPIFFALIFALIETGLVFLAGQVLETGVQDGARLVYTSQSKSAEDFKAAVCARVSALLDCSKLDIDVRSYDPGVPITIANPIDNAGNYTPAALAYEPPKTYPSSQTVVVRGFYQWPLIVTGLGYDIANIGRGTSSSKHLLAATAAVSSQ